MEFFRQLTVFQVSFLEELFSSADNIYVQRLLKLLFLGKYGPASPYLVEVFKALGLLHVLVLSGTQVTYLSRIHDRFFAFCLSYFNQRLIGIALWAFLLKLHLSLIFFEFGNLTQWTPPVTRALIFAFFRTWFSNYQTWFLAVITFGFQIGIFPSHFYERSFFLSWMFWVLSGCVGSLIKNEALYLATMALLSWAIMGFLFSGLGSLNYLASLPIIVVTAVVLGPWIERLLFPFGLGLVFFVVLSTQILVPLGFGEAFLGTQGGFLWVFWVSILEAIANTLLVGLWAFRYIQI